MSSSLQRIKRPTTEVTAAAVPSLPKGNDAEVAAKLEQLISAASNGLVVIATLGAFITHIKETLKHGEFDKWISAHCPNVSRQSVFRWRKICSNLIHDAGVTRRDLGLLNRPLHEILELPLGDLNDNEAKIVAQIRDQAQRSGYKKLENRSARSKPELSPEAKVAAENKGHFSEWLALVCSMERMLNDDSLGKAISHDPSVSIRMEQVRLAWGEKLKVVTRAHKSGKN